MSTGVPTRFPSGMTNCYPGEFLALYGNPNPFQLHRWEDDFDWLGATGVKYTITATSGSVAKSAGDGGTILFTTGATATNQASIQLVSAGFAPSLGKRMWYGARVNIEDVTAAQICLGLIQTTTTPATVADGIVFEKAAASTTWTLKNYVGSAANATITMPSTFLPVSGAAFDLGFYLNDKGYLTAFFNTVADGGLFGYYPQNSGVPYRGAIAGSSAPVTLTAVNLNPTMCILAGASGAELMTGDFLVAAKERA